MKSELFRKAGLLVAGPTSGKTILLNQLKAKGVDNVIDTDDLHKELIPEYFDEKWYRKAHSSEGIFINKMRDLVISNALKQRATGDSLFLTNLWGQDFLKTLFPANVKPMLYVGRISAKRISDLASERGAPLSEGLTHKWVASAEIYIPRVFEHQVWLPDNVYLANVVTASKGSWELTPLGKKLSRMTFQEVKKLGTLSEDQLKELGGTNVL